MARTLLIRGMVVGVGAGILAFLVAKALGESSVGHAIAFESAHEAHTGMASDPAVVSRDVQSTIGLLTAVTVFGIAIGGLFALVYAAVQGRLGAIGARGTAALVALGGFGAVYLIPSLKYPANPPSVGNPDTIGRRTALYFLMIAISLTVVITAAVVGRRLTERFGAWNGAILAAAGGLVMIGLAYAFLPRVHEVPAGFPAQTLWHFRVASTAVQATIWAALGLGFGAWTERALRPVARPARVPAPEPATP